MDYKAEYKRWCELATADGMKEILEKYDDAQVEDAFYARNTVPAHQDCLITDDKSRAG